MGSLLRLVQSDPTDIFLTGNPQITYFRSIYRRHTNFSLEIKEEKFNNITGFGLKSSLNIPKNADLMHRMYLKVKIPEFYINKSLDNNAISEKEKEYNNILNKYAKIKEFFTYNFEEYRTITNLFNTINEDDIITNDKANEILINWYETIKRINNVYELKYPNNSEDNINNIISNMQFNNFINKQKDITNTSTNRFIYATTNYGNIGLISLENYINDLMNSTNSNKPLNYYIILTAYNRCKFYIDKCKELDYYYFNYLQSIKKELDILKTPRYDFAWVDKLGHSIIDYVEITIGGQTIDKQYGFWLDVWHELNKNTRNEEFYNQLIGNVPELTTFDNTIKPEYILYIPLNFWFCKYEALSLPLISLQYSDIIFNVKFKKFSECAYTSFKYQNPSNVIENIEQHDLLDNILVSQHKNLEASLLIEYVYLDNAERRLFAKSSHEYLIEQTQIQRIDDINIINNDIQLNFIHPIKGIIWFAQYTNKYTNNDNTNKCLWTDYTFKIDNTNEFIKNGKYNKNVIIKNINPFEYCNLTLEGRHIAQSFSDKYYNYVIPWKTFKNTPVEGLNSFWFSLYPNEIQPSGFCNMGYIRETKLNYKLKLKEEELKEPYTIIILALNYNILRITSGMGAVAYI